MKRAVIFDMDGILIDSEPVWKETLIDVYGNAGMELTHDMLAETMGMRHDLVAAYWMRKFKREDLSLEVINQKVEEKMSFHVRNHVGFFPGAKTCFQVAKDAGYKIAIASSSPDVMINAVVERLGIQDILDTTHSAEHEKHGKPEPDVYITTAVKLDVVPEQCIAIEDSLNGLRSAKAANMKTIAIPDARYTSKDSTNGLADIVLESLEEVDRDLLGTLFKN